MKEFVRELTFLARDIYNDVRPDKETRRHLKYVQSMRKKHGPAWRIHTFGDDEYAQKILSQKELIEDTFPLHYFIGNTPLSRYLVCSYRRDHDGDLGETGDVYTSHDFSLLEKEVEDANVHTSTLPGLILDLDTGKFHYLDLQKMEFISFETIRDFRENVDF